MFWEDKAEVKQALDLLNLWCDIDVEDSLELLSPVFLHAKVRSHAVKVLGKAGDQVGYRSIS